MPPDSEIDPQNRELWDRATSAYGTAEIFQRRARRYKALVRFLTFYGLVIPLIIGSIAAAHLLAQVPLETVIYYGGALAVLQLVIFLWSVVANWPDSLDYSSASNADNLRLSNQLKALAEQSTNKPSDFEARYSALIAADNAQHSQDTRRDISLAEKAYGTRAGLLQFERICRVCKRTPESMKMPFWPGNRCPRCGGLKADELSEKTTHS
jgi:mobilome CxxCx(11)CxxC protein